jgi:hypothetical protein
LVESLEETLNLRERFSTIMDVLRLLALFLFIAHIFACSFHFLGTVEIELGYTTTWIHDVGLIGKPWHAKYIAAMYWS